MKTPTAGYSRSKFNNNTIGEHLGTHWPARSPDLTPCNQLYRRYPIVGRQQLKQHLVDIIQNIDTDMLARSCRSVKKRCNALLTVHGGHIEHIL